MKIAVIGTGYVGLVTGIGFAEKGNQVICVDNNQAKLDVLRSGKSPIWEKGLDELIVKNLESENIVFTDDLQYAVEESEIIFLCLPTPPQEDGSADLSYVITVSKEIARHIKEYRIIVNKSTVPVGSTEIVRNHLLEYNKDCNFDVVSNPEFLKEGNAVLDFMEPERVVIGTSSNQARQKLVELYLPFVQNEKQILLMDEKSSELTKYAANSFLATKITFINQIADLCELNNADVELVAKGMGLDSRIGPKFLKAGIGYGGSCFPKDVSALIKYSDGVGYDFSILKQVQAENTRRKIKPIHKLVELYGDDFSSLKVGVWGLAFKPETDDVREAPSAYIIRELLDKKAKSVIAFDPVAMDSFREFANLEKEYKSRIDFVSSQYEVLEDIDVLIICTEWDEFISADRTILADKLRGKVVFDGRNIWDTEEMLELGIKYYSVGR
jgi:UDPglucose 6-dehydrogenase